MQSQGHVKMAYCCVASLMLIQVIDCLVGERKQTEFKQITLHIFDVKNKRKQKEIKKKGRIGIEPGPLVRKVNHYAMESPDKH